MWNYTCNRKLRLQTEDKRAIMVRYRNTKHSYGAVAIFFHWLLALIVISLLIMGLYMMRLPLSMEKVRLIGWHKEIGLLVLVLVILRGIWRLSHDGTELPTSLPFWQRVAARAVHLLFYIFLLALPISGWLISSATGLQVSFFGLIVLPNLIAPDPQLLTLFIEIHRWLAYGLIITLFLHTGAALIHHFIYKDDILRRILP